MRPLLFAAAGLTPNATSASGKTCFFLSSSSETQALLVAMVFLNQALNLIVFSALVNDPLKTSLNMSNRLFFEPPSAENYIACQGSCSSPTLTMRFCSASDGTIMELACTVWGVPLSNARINAALKALDKSFIL